MQGFYKGASSKRKACAVGFLNPDFHGLRGPPNPMIAEPFKFQCVYLHNHLSVITMKKLSFIVIIILLASCNSSQKFPEKMPSDFKIEYHLDGGMVNMNRTVVLQNGECVDKGRIEDGADFEFKIVISKPEELEALYADLKKLKVFEIRGKGNGEVMDRGGESLRFTINGKTYDVDNSQSNFISTEDGPAFDQSIALILKFADSHRIEQPEKTSEEDLVGNEKVDSLSTGKDTEPVVGSDDKLAGSTDENIKVVFPPKMPNDFTIEYNMSGGITGAYRKIVLQYGSSTDEGKKAGEAKYSSSFMNMNLKDFEALYIALYKLDAFSLEYTKNNKVADRGGEMLTYTINNKVYKVSDKDQDYIKSSDKNAFKKSITLVLEYVDTHK